MFAIISCLQQQDLRLVAWAVAICVIAVAAGLGAYRRAVSTNGGHRGAWLAITALLLGSGVWATHFIAMLADHSDQQISFGLGLSVLALVVGVAGLGAGAAIAALYPSRAGRAGGGALCGAVIAVMHFVCVSAIRGPTQIHWDPVLVGAAIAISVGAASAAFLTAGRLSDIRRSLGAGALLVIAVSGLHFTAMAALHLTPEAGPHHASQFGRHELAIAAGVLVGLILLAGGALMAIEELSARTTLADLQSALDCAPTGLALFDKDQRLRFWNAGYADNIRSYGVTLARGTPASALLQLVSDWDPESRIASQWLKSGLTSRLEVDGAIMAPNGRWRLARTAPTRDGGTVVVLSDVTEQFEALQLAEAGNRAKDEFLANMSHEIRTPLNGVLGMVQVMACDPLMPEQLERLEIIGATGRSLLTTLDGLLDLSKIEAGKLKVEIQPFDLAETVDLAVGLHAPLAAHDGLRLSVDIHPQARGVWFGDDAKLRQVLSNLLSNAVKFTPHGAIDLRVAPVPGGLSFEVTDTGVGIAPEKLELIFDSFTQADASMTRRYGGAGLGLAICRRFVALMGGDLTVSSREGEGSTFAFTLPLLQSTRPLAQAAEQEPEATIAIGPPVQTQHGARRLRVLAAEDNLINQRVLAALLKPFEIDLTIVCDGRQAVEAQAANRFDLILMDIQMPRMNGIDACLEIRRAEQQAHLPRTPIVALTANVMRRQVDSYLRAGMDGVVAKPVELSLLLAGIEAALSGRSEQGIDEPDETARRQARFA